MRTYTESGDKDRLIRVLQDLVATDADDLAHRTQLARLLLDAGRLADAERYARQGLEIDVLDADAQRALGDALLGQKKFGDAVEAYQTVLQIDERSDEARVKLAEAYLGKGDKDKARYEVARVLARDPANADAKRVQADLDK